MKILLSKTQWLYIGEKSGWLKTSSNLQLPPIPNGFVRLQHTTNINSAKAIINGGFKFGRQGLSQTTDSFSNNNSLMNFLNSGRPDESSKINRSGFGDNTVVLIDLSNDEARKLLSDRFTIESDIIPNNRIVGYVSTDRQFYPNGNYNVQNALNINAIGPIMPQKPRQAVPQQQPQVTPQQSQQTGSQSDIW